MLGYDLYSSALADILSEPTMQPPICVGLYAQWGSGKSFLLKKLEGNIHKRSPHVLLTFSSCSPHVLLTFSSHSLLLR